MKKQFTLSIMLLLAGSLAYGQTHLPGISIDTSQSDNGEKHIIERFTMQDADATWHEIEMHKHFFANGQPEKTYSLSDGIMEGLYQTYFLNGNTNELSFYRNGMPVGRYIQYFPNGKIAETGRYAHTDKPLILETAAFEVTDTNDIGEIRTTMVRDEIRIFPKEGYWSYRDTSGNIICQEFWKITRWSARKISYNRKNYNLLPYWIR